MEKEREIEKERTRQKEKRKKKKKEKRKKKRKKKEREKERENSPKREAASESNFSGLGDCMTPLEREEETTSEQLRSCGANGRKSERRKK